MLLTNLSCVLALTAAAAAQGTTWVVGRPGFAAHFATIQEAVNAAVDGDTILVRAGNYFGFSTGKALTVLGEDTAFLEPSGTSGPVVEVANLPAGRTFVMKNFEVSATFALAPDGGVSIHNCAGSVHFEDISTATLDYLPGVGLAIDAAAQVTISGGRWIGRPAIRVGDGCDVTIVDSTVTGVSACGGSPLCSVAGADAGIEVGASTLHLARTQVSGGDGSRSLLPGVIVQPAAAIRSSGSALEIRGDSSTRITAGSFVGGNPTDAITTLTAAPSTISVDPSVSVQGSQGGLDISPAHTTTRRALPSVTAAGAGPGGIAQIGMWSTPLDPVSILVSLPTQAATTPFGDLWIDPRSSVAVFSGLQSLAGTLQLALTVPMDPSLVGRAFAAQAAVFNVATSRLDLTNGAVFVLH